MKIEDLSDEELLQLAGETSEEPSTEPTSNLSNLSDEELLAMAEQSGALTEPKQPDSALPETTSAESLIRGAAQGLTLGYADEISGGIESLFSDKTYEQARDESRQEFERAQVENPNAYIFGNLAGGVASTIATGGATAGIRGAAIVGGLSGVGFSNRTGSDLIKDATIGAAFGASSELVAKGIGKYVAKMFAKSSPATRRVFSDLGETTRPENVKWEANLMKDAFTGRYNTADEWIMSDTFGAKVQQALDDTPDLMRKIVKDKQTELGLRIESIADDLPVKNIDVSDIIDNFKKSVKEGLRQSGPDVGAAKVIRNEILDKLDDGTFGMMGDQALDINNMTPRQAIDLKRAVQEIVYAETTPDGMVNLLKNSPRANEMLSQLGAQITDKANKLDPTGALKEVNRQYSQLMQAKQLIPFKNESHKLLGLQQTTGASKAAGDMRILRQTLEGVDPQFNQLMINEINPRLTAYQLHQAAKFQGGTVSTMFRAKAGAGALGQTVGPAGELIGGVLGAGDAAAINAANALNRARSVFKVPRTLAGVFQNSDMIVSKLSQVSPALAIALNDAVSDGDENKVEEIITQVMQHPQASDQFEEGFGFNGKAVTPQEFEQAKNQIMSARVPLREKIMAVNNLNATGQLPQPVQEAPRIPQLTQLQEKRQGSLKNLERLKQLEKLEE